VFRSLATILLVSVLGAALAGPSDNSVVIGTSQEPTAIGDTLALLGSQAIASEHNVWMFSGLYRIDIDTGLQPDLVTEVATVDNGRMVIEPNASGGQKVTFNLTLRDDVRWSDGTPITTADLDLAYDMVKTPGMPLPGIAYWQRVSYSSQDARNFTVVVDPAQSSDLVQSPMSLLPAHVLGSAWTSAKAAAQGVDAARANEIFRAVISEYGSAAGVNAGRTVVSGAFKPVRWVQGSAMVLERNPFYHAHPENQSAYAQRVEFRYINDTNALLFQVVTGAVDTTASVSITFDQALSPQLTSRATGTGARYDIWFVPGAVWEHLEVNQFTNVQQVADLKLDDIRTRRAIIHAMDRQGMTDALFEGLQPVSHSNVAPADPNYNPDVPQYDYDPETARALLAELGWTPGPDGILQRVEGGRTIRFELEFATTAGNAVRERQQQFIAADLQAVGIAVRINNAPSNVVFAPAFSQRAYDGAWTGLFMFAWVSSQSSSLSQAGYLCSARPTPENSYSGQNYGGGCSPRYDALREQAVAELDPAKAKPIYQEMQNIFAEDLLAIPLIFRTTPYVVSKGLLNYATSTFANGNGYPPTLPALVGWSQNGAQQVVDQADYATKY
jgi:peptide/nickel transport system substrate-binding protein